jgi:hypothetical protein
VYATRPLRVADVAGLERFDKLTDDEGYALLDRFFAPDRKPDLKGLAEAGKIGALELLGIATAMGEYFRTSIEKNSKAVVAQISGAATAAASGSTPPNS